MVAAAFVLWSCSEGSPGITPPPPPPPPPFGAGNLQSITPVTAFAGSPDLTLTLHGSHFVEGMLDGSKAVWVANDTSTSLPTTFVSSTQLTALVPAALLGHPGTVRVFVQTGDPEDGIPFTKSNELAFSIHAPQQSSISIISAISPTGATAGSPDLTLTITGANFVGAPHNRSQAVWAANGDTTLLVTASLSSTELTAVIPAALGTLIVYGRPNQFPAWIEGWREVTLDRSPWRVLREGESLTYNAPAGVHSLLLSNPCTSTHEPSTMYVSIVGGDTVTVSVYIPPDCE
jgi:hypothetical protein